MCRKLENDYAASDGDERTIYLRLSVCPRDANRVKWPNITHVCHHTRRQHSHYVNIIQIPKRLEIISQSVCVHRQHKGVASSTEMVPIDQRRSPSSIGKFEFERVCRICRTAKGMTKSSIVCIRAFIYGAFESLRCQDIVLFHSENAPKTICGRVPYTETIIIDFCCSDL